MNKKQKIFVLVTILAISLIFFANKYSGIKNTFSFPKTLKAQNNTDYELADTAALVISDKILNLDTIDIQIFYMSPIWSRENANGFKVYGYTTKHLYKPHNYLIFLNADIDSKLFRVLAHEMIHIKQMETGNLISINDSICVFKNDTINLFNMECSKRPYEIEALNEETSVLIKLNKLLYTKNEL